MPNTSVPVASVFKCLDTWHNFIYLFASYIMNWISSINKIGTSSQYNILQTCNAISLFLWISVNRKEMVMLLFTHKAVHISILWILEYLQRYTQYIIICTYINNIPIVTEIAPVYYLGCNYSAWRYFIFWEV